MSAVYDFIKGAFAFIDAPFGSHPRDYERALQYRAAAVAAGLSWANAEQDVRTYCAGYPGQDVEKQVERARKILAGHLR